MATIEDGAYQVDTVRGIENVLLANLQQNFDRTINEGDLSVFRLFYRPVAEQLVELQNDLDVVLKSAQINHAEGKALDLLVELVGVFREDAVRATGEVRFWRDTAATQDYGIPKGTYVQTSDDEDPIRFQTTEYGEITDGTTEVTVPVEAVEPGQSSNVAADTVTVMPNSPVGIQHVNNPNKIDGGVDRETDDELRERAKEELSKGSVATAGAIITAVTSINGTTSAKVFPNYEHDFGTDPGFELVVEGGDSVEIAETVLDKKAVGDYTYSGNYGTGVTETVTAMNGQDYDLSFSRPTKMNLSVSFDLNTDDTFEGKDVVKDAIVDYIGGVNSLGQTVHGDINVNEDVIFGEVEYAIRSVQGVYDVSNLELTDKDTSTTYTGNITIGTSELALTDVADMTVTLV